MIKETWIVADYEGTVVYVGDYEGAKKAYVKKRVKGVGIDFSDENLDLAIDKTVEKLTEAGVINAHLKE